MYEEIAKTNEESLKKPVSFEKEEDLPFKLNEMNLDEDSKWYLKSEKEGQGWKISLFFPPYDDALVEQGY